MPNWMDILEGFGGAAGGVAKGLTAGMEPFHAWEGVRAQDLANDRTDIKIRDEEGAQSGREGIPDFYLNRAGETDVGYRKAISQGESDIYNIDKNFKMHTDLADPNGEFQTQVRERGLTPQDAEYRLLYSKYSSQYFPRDSITDVDKMHIPELQQQNLNRQATIGFLQKAVDEKYPGMGAKVQENEDGTVSIVDPAGNTLADIAPERMSKFAAEMGNPKGSAAEIQSRLEAEGKFQRNQADIINILRGDKQQAAQVKQQMASLAGEYRIANAAASRINGEIKVIDNDKSLSEAERNEKKGPLLAKKALIEADLHRLTQSYRRLEAGVPMVGGGGGAPQQQMGPPSSLAPPTSGDSSQTTNTALAPVAKTINTAKGNTANPAPVAASPPGRTPGVVNGRDTGIRPIGGIGGIGGNDPRGPWGPDPYFTAPGYGGNPSLQDPYVPPGYGDPTSQDAYGAGPPPEGISTPYSGVLGWNDQIMAQQAQALAAARNWMGQRGADIRRGGPTGVMPNNMDDAQLMQYLQQLGLGMP